MCNYNLIYIILLYIYTFIHKYTYIELAPQIRKAAFLVLQKHLYRTLYLCKSCPRITYKDGNRTAVAQGTAQN